MQIQLRSLLVITILLSALAVHGQRRGRGNQDEWPPDRAYGRTTLGNALQGVFERHHEFCGFGKAEGKRDYTPPSLERSLGSRDLRTRVEKADVNGGNLLNYIFTGLETQAPFDEIRFQPDRLLFNRQTGVDLDPQPRPGFDAFLLTKNCSGYLKASLDAGLKPPYAAFTSALDADDRRSSTVAALAGSFVSPLQEILAANDLRTTELMASLWQFYQQQPQYVDGAYYLARFEGVMIKHLTDSEQVTSFERGVGVNVSIPLAGHIGGELSLTKQSGNQYSGTDWETIVYTDFSGPYQRSALFAKLPTPADIQRYFRSKPVVQAKGGPGLSPIREGALHRQQVSIPGIPSGLAGTGWYIDNMRGGAYRGSPELRVDPQQGSQGLTFIVSAQSSSDLFQIDGPGTIEVVPMYYDLVMPARAGLPELRIPVQQNVPTSRHPLLDDSGARFELQRENNGQFAFRWHLTFNVTDAENPLDHQNAIKVRDIKAGYAGSPVDTELIEAVHDARRGTVTIVLQTNRTWPLSDIDDRHMRTLPLSLRLELPVVDGFSAVVREVSTRLAIPTIRLHAVPSIGN